MTISQYPLLALAALLFGGAAAAIDYILGYSYGPIGIVIVFLIICVVILEHKTDIVGRNT